jgi:hypothetical protein
MSEEFKNDVHEWDRINNLIRQYEENLKSLREEKKKIQESAIEYMRNNEIDILNMEDGKIICKKSKVKVNSLTKKNLIDKLREFFIVKERFDPGIAQMKANLISEYIDTLSEYKESYTLSRTKKSSAKSTV